MEDVTTIYPWKHSRLHELKATSGQKSALDGIWFRRPFHPDCMDGELCGHSGTEQNASLPTVRSGLLALMPGD